MRKRGNYMEKSKKKVRIPEDFNDPMAASDFWDNHSVGDFLDGTTEVNFDVKMKKEPKYVALESELSIKVAKISRQKGISPETLVNLWVKEKVSAK